jgi:predicted nucleotidyltransferase
MIQHPTPYPDVNHLLQVLFERMQTILGEQIIAMYLEGSLASGDFDQDSDIDFVLVTKREITADIFLALQTMHEQIAALDSIWAIQLEGSYLTNDAIRRYDPAQTFFPNIERGQGERLKWVDHDQIWDIHRHILRERGIVLVGPPPHTLIDPISPGQLRQAMQVILSKWAMRILNNPAQMNSRGYQSYTVLSLCRILYTLAHGTIASKPIAAAWAQETLEEGWHPLIERAWEGRHNPGLEPDPGDLNGTLEFIRHTMDRARLVN